MSIRFAKEGGVMAYKLHCDLCGVDISKEENTTTVTWKDNNGYDYEFGHVFRKPRKFKADICDRCIEMLREKAKKAVE